MLLFLISAIIITLKRTCDIGISVILILEITSEVYRIETKQKKKKDKKIRQS